MQPIQVLPLGFLAIILVGGLALTLPAMTVDGKGLSLFDALFTATSASCVTGLIVVDTGTHFTFLGQLVVLLLIQLGGLGFMSVTTLLFMMMGKRISLRERMTLAESLGEDRLQGVVGLCIRVVRLTFIIEFIGAALLCIRFIPLYGAGKGIWYSIFHSISAFCNAGFDLIGGYRSLTPFADDALINFTIMLLIIFGGIGFSVILDALQKKKFSKLKLHSKLALCGSGILIVAGALLFLLFEGGNTATMGNMPFGEKLLASLFQSVTTRTAGFNTIDQLAMTDASKLVSIFLMLIGGSPAGTAGGLKVTTVLLVTLSAWSYIKNRQDIVAFKRRIPYAAARRATCLFLIGMVLLVTFGIIVSFAENGTAAGQLGMENILYEIASGLGTVGLTSGVTALASPFTRVVLMLSMYLGRVGMLTVALSLGTRLKNDSLLHFPEETIMIG